MRALLVCAIVAAASAVPQDRRQRGEIDAEQIAARSGDHESGVRYCKSIPRRVYSIEYRDEYTTPCVPRFVENCTVAHRLHTVPYQEQHCEPVPKSRCFPSWVEVERHEHLPAPKRIPHIRDDCSEVLQEVCENIWVMTHGDKTLECDPRTRKTFKITQCKKTCDERSSRIQLPPYYKTVWKKVDDCSTVFEQVCTYKTKTKNVLEPYMSCYEWEDEECTCHHKQVPYQIEKQILVKDCGSIPNDVETFGSGTVFGVRSGGLPEPAADAVYSVVEGSEKATRLPEGFVIPNDNDFVDFD